MQSEIFQAFIGYNFDDYGLQLLKTFSGFFYHVDLRIYTWFVLKRIKKTI